MVGPHGWSTNQCKFMYYVLYTYMSIYSAMFLHIEGARAVLCNAGVRGMQNGNCASQRHIVVFAVCIY